MPQTHLPGAGFPLDDVFRQSGVDATATSGSLGIPLRFEDNVRDGAKILLGLQLTDGTNKQSNCEALKLHFDVDSVGG